MSIEDPQYCFEYVLILGELNSYEKANDTLCMIAKNYSFETEEPVSEVFPFLKCSAIDLKGL